MTLKRTHSEASDQTPLSRIMLSQQQGICLRDMFAKRHGIDVRSPASNANNWRTECKRDPELLSLLRDKLNGVTILDLGAGEHWIGMLRFARFIGAGAYIGVDRYMHGVPTPGWRGPRFPSAKVSEGRCPAVIVRADALEFIKAVKPDSCAIMLNYIDRVVIADARYHRQLAVEIGRVVPRGGLAMGINSEAISLLPELDCQMPNLSSNRQGRHFENVRNGQLICQSEPVSSPDWLSHSRNLFDKIFERR